MSQKRLAVGKALYSSVIRGPSLPETTPLTIVILKILGIPCQKLIFPKCVLIDPKVRLLSLKRLESQVSFVAKAYLNGVLRKTLAALAAVPTVPSRREDLARAASFMRSLSLLVSAYLEDRPYPWDPWLGYPEREGCI
jgi:hypothetical protein